MFQNSSMVTTVGQSFFSSSGKSWIWKISPCRSRSLSPKRTNSRSFTLVSWFFSTYSWRACARISSTCWGSPICSISSLIPTRVSKLYRGILLRSGDTRFCCFISSASNLVFFSSRLQLVFCQRNLYCKQYVNIITQFSTFFNTLNINYTFYCVNNFNMLKLF